MKCAVDVAPIRSAPRDDAEQVTQALLYEPLRVEEHHGDWARVVTAYNYPGWILESALADGDGELPTLIAGPPLIVARSYLGAPYEWGGLSKRGIDCSGLVHIAYRLSGRLVPRDSWQQEMAGTRLDEADLRRGDLITYGAGELADHVAFALGDDHILHSTGREGLGVVVEPEPAGLRESRRFLIRL